MHLERTSKLGPALRSKCTDSKFILIIETVRAPHDDQYVAAPSHLTTPLGWSSFKLVTQHTYAAAPRDS